MNISGVINYINPFAATVTSLKFNWDEIVRNNNYEQLSSVDSAYLKEINTPLSDGNYPVHAAVRLGYPQMVKKLIEKGAKPELKDRQGLMAYDYALLRGNIDLLNILLPSETAQTLLEALEASQTTFLQQKDTYGRATQRLRESKSAYFRLPSKGKKQKTHNTSLHSTLLLEDPTTIMNQINGLSDNIEQASSLFLKEDDQAMTPFTTLACVDWHSHLEEMLNLCKKNPQFDINATHKTKGFSLASLGYCLQSTQDTSYLMSKWS